MIPLEGVEVFAGDGAPRVSGDDPASPEQPSQW